MCDGAHRSNAILVLPAELKRGCRAGCDTPRAQPEACHQTVAKLTYEETCASRQNRAARIVALRGNSMILRRLPIATGIVTAIVTVAASIVTPAAAEILAVCANSAQSSESTGWSSPLADAIIPLGGRLDESNSAMIALWRDDAGFDVLINWGETRERSLRADGAQIVGGAPSSDLVHLMVAHAEGGLEHFLFNLNEDGSGELMRSSTSGDPAAPSVCTKPH